MPPGKKEKREARRKEKGGKRTDEDPHLLYIPLNAHLSDILVFVEQHGLLQPPRSMKDNPKRQQSENTVISIKTEDR